MQEKKKKFVTVFLFILLIASVCINVYLLNQLNGIKQQLPQIQSQLSTTQGSLDAANQELTNIK